MQAQLQPIVAIQIGTMNVQLTAKGIPPSGSNLAKKRYILYVFISC
jgi:hypothetical protein